MKLDMKKTPDHKMVTFARTNTWRRRTSCWPNHRTAARARVRNAGDYALDWRWEAVKGYPDQYRPDRVVVVDRSRLAPSESAG